MARRCLRLNRRLFAEIYSECGGEDDAATRSKSKPTEHLLSNRLKKKGTKHEHRKITKKKNQLCNDIGNRKLINGLGLKVLVNV